MPKINFEDLEKKKRELHEKQAALNLQKKELEIQEYEIDAAARRAMHERLVAAAPGLLELVEHTYGNCDEDRPDWWDGPDDCSRCLLLLIARDKRVPDFDIVFNLSFTTSPLIDPRAKRY